MNRRNASLIAIFVAVLFGTIGVLGGYNTGYDNGYENGYMDSFNSNNIVNAVEDLDAYHEGYADGTNDSKNIIKIEDYGTYIIKEGTYRITFNTEGLDCFSEECTDEFLLELINQATYIEYSFNGTHPGYQSYFIGIYYDSRAALESENITDN